MAPRWMNRHRVSPSNRIEVVAAALAGFVAVALNVLPAMALVPGDPALNAPVCVAPGLQLVQPAIPDGSGGAIVAWSDQNSGLFDVYVHRILPSGWVDPAWPANGVAVCTASSFQNGISMATDGAGGAYVTWYDNRTLTSSDLYVQHVLASGVVDPAWPVNGLGVCVLPSFVDGEVIASDGAGGAIVAWSDNRSGNFDIYAQHVLSGGTVDITWPANGRALCTAPGNQFAPDILSDGAGGAMVTFYDGRSGNADIYIHRILASGIADPAWPVDGLALCILPGTQDRPRLTSDGAGGAIVAWQDGRSTSVDIYAQHVLPAGIVDGAWPVNGRAACTEAHNQGTIGILEDGAGGAFLVWEDARPTSGSLDLYGTHVLASGALDGAWPVNGLAICTAPQNQLLPSIASDGSGGAILAWEDQRAGLGQSIFAQHLLATGVDPAWPVNGREVSSGSDSKAKVVPTGTGAAIVAWTDGRSGNGDVYSQLLNPDGTLAPDPFEIITASTVGPGTISPAGAVYVADGFARTFTMLPTGCQTLDVLVDGVSVGAVTSYTFTNVTANHTIQASFTPCPHGTIEGTVTSHCPTPGTPLLGVTVDVFAVGSGDLMGTAVTDASGAYVIPDITAMPYTVSLVTPLGFTTTAEVPVTLGGGATLTVDFDLECVASSGNPGSSGFWKHQFGIATGSNGNAQVDPGSLCGYLDMIEGHFNDNALNQVVVYDPPPASDCPQKLALAKGLLNLGGSPDAIDKARQQLLSLLLNVAANHVGLTDVVSKDGATASQAITHCDQLIDNPMGDRLLATSIAEKINSGQKVNAGVIPLSTQQIAYRTGLGLRTFRVTPNATGGWFSFQFTMGRRGSVRLAVYDVSGRLVRVLMDGIAEAGEHSASWAGVPSSGGSLGSGVYFARLEADGDAKTLKVIRLKN